MPNPDDDLLRRLLVHNREARDEAKRILVQARSATGPGTGYDISDGKTGLAAICAYLATVKTGYDDLDLTTAQKASCLEPKIFKRTLETVKNALEAKRAPSLSRNNSNTRSWRDGRSREQRTLRDSFLPIIEKHRLGRPKLVATWMQWTYSSMKEHLEAEMIQASDQDLRIAAYQYVAGILKKPAKSEPLCAEYKVLHHRHMDLLAMAKRCCKDVTREIQHSIEELSQKVKTAPSRSSARLSPSKSTSTVANNTAPEVARPVSPNKSSMRAPGTTRPLKRAVSFHEDAPEDTPSKPKRLRTSSPYKTPFTPTADELYKDVPKTPAPAVLQPRYTRQASDSHSDDARSDAGRSDLGSGSEVERELQDIPASSDSEEHEPQAIPYRESSPGMSLFRTPRKDGGDGQAHRTPYAKKPPPELLQRSSPSSLDFDGPEPDGDEEAVEPEDEPEAEDELLPPVRRFRPVLLDRAQWSERAPKLTAEWARAKQDFKAWTAKYGRPFESLRA
ncbi:unnamed protein product [Peniophora sp. CBMAI 1063]|nr:unnamed protein product [Peniophora sp. CBMAI 1063]